MSYELGSSAHDTVELRDGSVINGDLESVSATELVIRIGGKHAALQSKSGQTNLASGARKLTRSPAACGSETVKKKSRHRLPVISEQMKAWSAALEAELVEWPRVSSRAMFGLTHYTAGSAFSQFYPALGAWGTPTLSLSNLRELDPASWAA